MCQLLQSARERPQTAILDPDQRPVARMFLLEGGGRIRGRETDYHWPEGGKEEMSVRKLQPVHPGEVVEFCLGLQMQYDPSPLHSTPNDGKHDQVDGSLSDRRVQGFWACRGLLQADQVQVILEQRHCAMLSRGRMEHISISRCRTLTCSRGSPRRRSMGAVKQSATTSRCSRASVSQGRHRSLSPQRGWRWRGLRGPRGGREGLSSLRYRRLGPRMRITVGGRGARRA